MTSKCEQAWHSCQQDKSIHVPSPNVVNDVSSLSSLGMEPVSPLKPVQIEWPANVSKRDMHANKRQTNPRTEPQQSQWHQFSEFARNRARELIKFCSNRMARKCELAWHSCQQDKYIHVPSHSKVNDVSAPSSLGMEPVSPLKPVQREWQDMWASVTFMPTRQTNPRTEPQQSQRRQFPEFARNWTRELIINCSNRMAGKCELAWHSCQQDTPIHVPRFSVVNDVSSPSSLGIEPVTWL
jgi:hypothetical protein